jgi:hypothetical protein
MIGELAAPVRSWNGFWFGLTGARPLGAFRLMFGFCVLIHLVLLAPDLDQFVTDAGILRGEESKQLAGVLRWSILQEFQSPGAVRVVFAVTTAAAVLVVLGLHTRVACVVQYLGLLSIHHRNLLTNSGADSLMVILAFLLMFTASGRAYSLDGLRLRRRLGGEYEPVCVPWAQRLMQIQISILYFMTAFWKCQGETWAEGTALHYVLSNSEIRRWTFGLLTNEHAINALTYGALGVEFALAFLLWVKAARPFVIAAGVALHVGIMFTVNIPVFGELMMSSYLLYLTPGEFEKLRETVALRRRLSRFAGRGFMAGAGRGLETVIKPAYRPMGLRWSAQAGMKPGSESAVSGGENSR